MSIIPELDEYVRATDEWISDLNHHLGWHHRGRAYFALYSTLHALRDALPLQEAIYLGAQLPPLLRGVYYEGWHPAELPLLPSRASFLSRIHDGLHRDVAIEPEQVARTVLALLADRIDAAELENVKAATPGELRSLWRS
jgi:uncharacterized protein (DUF2267 family)